MTFFRCVTGDKILASSYILNIIRISANHPYCLCGQGESPLYRELVHSNASPPQAYIPMCPSPYTNQPVYSIAPSPSIFDVRSVYHLRHNVLRPVRTTTQSTILLWVLLIMSIAQPLQAPVVPSCAVIRHQHLPLLYIAWLLPFLLYISRLAPCYAAMYLSPLYELVMYCHPYRLWHSPLSQ